MEKQTLDRLTVAFKAVEKDLSERVADLAAKSSSGRLSEEERAEYEQIVRLNDLLSMLKLPRKQRWPDHFQLQEDGRIVGTTPEGRATARLLDFNAEDRLQLRRVLMRQGWRP